MKKTVFMAVAAVLALASCNNQAPKMDEKAQKDSVQNEMRIAYVEVDSIMTQYKFCKYMEPILEKKAQNSRNTLAQKQQSLQAAAAKFQQDLQNNKYTQQQAEQVNAGLQKQNADLQALAQRLDNELANEQQKYLQAVNDSIQHFLDQYNKTKKFAFIVTKNGLLYADKAYDITSDVINGLNKAYKGNTSEKASDAKKDAKEKK